MNRLTVSILALLLLISCGIYAQQSVIRGTVTDENTGDPLPFVNIGISGQSAGTFSDAEGHFRMELNGGVYQLIFSSVGYNKYDHEIQVDGKRSYTLNIRLKSFSQELNTVVVSASKYAQKIQESSSSIEVMKAKNVENVNLTTADKAVDRMPGVTIVNNEPQIRAASGFSSGLGSRVMVMSDEIPLLRGDAGRPDWALLPMEDIEQIELVKGASSVVFGSSAINGVINVRTAWPKEDAETKLTSFLGVYSKPEKKYATPWTGINPLQFGVTLTHSQRLGNVDLTGGINYFKDQGYIGGSPEGTFADTIFNKGTYSKRIKFYFNSRVRSKKINGLTYGLNGTFLSSEIAENYFWYDADTNIYRSFPGSLSKNKGFTCFIDPFVKYYAPNGDAHSFKNRFYYLTSDGLYNQSSLSTSVFNEYQYSHKFRFLGNLLLIAGVTNIYTYTSGKVFSGKLAPDGTPTLGENGSYTSENLAGYLQLEKKFFNRLSIQIGGRYEYYHLADIYETKPVFRAGINYQAAKGSFLRISAGQGYRVPSIGERYITTTSGSFGFYPNPSLASESSVSYEIGIRQLFKAGKIVGMIDAAGFYENYDRYVELCADYWGMNLTDPRKNMGFKFFNTGKARIYGIDISAAGEGDIARGINLGASVSYTWSMPQSMEPDYIFYYNPYDPAKSKTYLNTSSDTNGHILKYRVQSLFKADIQVSWKRFSTGISGRYYGYMKNIEKFLEDALDNQLSGVNTGLKKYRADHNQGSYLVDCRVSCQVRNFKLSVIVNNLFNSEVSLRPMTVEPPRMTQLQLVYRI